MRVYCNAVKSQLRSDPRVRLEVGGQGEFRLAFARGSPDMTWGDDFLNPFSEQITFSGSTAGTVERVEYDVMTEDELYGYLERDVFHILQKKSPSDHRKALVFGNESVEIWSRTKVHDYDQAVTCMDFWNVYVKKPVFKVLKMTEEVAEVEFSTFSAKINPNRARFIENLQGGWNEVQVLTLERKRYSKL
jgi:hypothetical protein